jgi:hypothetical protein
MVNSYFNTFDNVAASPEAALPFLGKEERI